MSQQDRSAEQPERRSRGRKRAPVKPGTRPARATATHRGGKPGFVPTATEREFVRVMSGLRMTTQEICRVIGFGRGEQTNNKSRGGKPIARSTLWRYFRNELDSGHSLLRAEIAGRWRAALANGERWAVEAGLRNKFGWDPGRYGGLIEPPDAGDVLPLTQVEFVVPGKVPEAPEWQPPEGPRLLPAPREMRQNPFGIWEEAPPNDGRPRKPGDWMG